jgi:hypothetical protein
MGKIQGRNDMQKKSKKKSAGGEKGVIPIYVYRLLDLLTVPKD